MELNRIKLGKYIEPFSEACNIPNLTVNDVSGVNRDKEFFEPSTQVGADTSKYKIVPPGYYACNLMHVGRDVVLPIAYNHSQNNKIVSPAYQVFRFVENDELLTEYFFLYLKSSEKDRYFWFNTDGSVRDGMSWNDFIDVEIELPSIDIQQKYVDVYNAMLENQKSYERGLEDLKLVCDAYIEELRREINSEPIGKYICEIRNKNESNLSLKNRSVSNTKIFIDAKEAVVSGAKTSNYLIVENMDFAYNTVTTRNADKISIALNKDGRCLVSPIYTVFRVVKEGLLPDYLFLWLQRSEYDRFARFESWGSAREVFSFTTLSETKIPIPNINKQKSITCILNAFEERRSINEKLKSQIKNLCPILIKGSIEEAKRS